jgi:tRNA(Arg) A34 adenosine deaminase TadA
LKLLTVAAKIAAGSDDLEADHRRQYLIAALSERTDGAIVTSINLTVQVPAPTAHAESRVLRKSDAGCTLYVARVTRDGRWAMSKPCPSCQKIIRSKRVKKVYYTIGEGEYGIWNVGKDEWTIVRRVLK